MIFGIGTDIVRVGRIQDNLDRHGERFSQRILTEAELVDYAKSVKPAHFLAKRFAAKEAVVKAMGTGFTDGISLHDIGVGHDAKGKPLLEFSGHAAQFLLQHQIRESHISLADEEDHAVAFVTLIRG